MKLNAFSSQYKRVALAQRRAPTTPKPSLETKQQTKANAKGKKGNSSSKLRNYSAASGARCAPVTILLSPHGHISATATGYHLPPAPSASLDLRIAPRLSRSRLVAASPLPAQQQQQQQQRMEAGLALQTRAAGFGSGRRRGGLQSPIGSLRVADPAGAAVAAGFGSGRRRGGLQSPIGSLRVADPAGAAVAVRARGSKPVAPLRAKKSFGGTAPSPLCFLHYAYCGQIGVIRFFFWSSLSLFLSRSLRIRFALIAPMLLGRIWIRHYC